MLLDLTSRNFVDETNLHLLGRSFSLECLDQSLGGFGNFVCARHENLDGARSVPGTKAITTNFAQVTSDLLTKPPKCFGRTIERPGTRNDKIYAAILSDSNDIKDAHVLNGRLCAHRILPDG